MAMAHMEILVAAPADTATPIAPGEIEIHAQVSLTVQLK
jgi:uncharacterized protein YggE